MPVIQTDEATIIDLLTGFKGEQPDNDIVELPAWKRARNIWVDASKRVRSRPHFVPVTENYVAPLGLAYDGQNNPLFVADGTLRTLTDNVATIAGTSPVRFDAHRKYTIVTAGGRPILYRGPGDFVILPQTNVKCLATFQGAQKLRMIYVKTDDLHRLYFTPIGDLTDEGSVIVDPHSVADDEYTEAFSIRNFPHEIVDLKELNEGILMATRRGWYQIQVGIDEDGFRPRISGKIINIETVDSPVRGDEGQIWCMSPDGVKRIFYDQGYPTFSVLPMEGIEQAIAPTDQSRVSVDKLRDLVFYCPDMSSGITYVHHLKYDYWTSWNVMIRDAVSANGVTYVVLEGEPHIYKLDDDFVDDGDPIELELRLGLCAVPTASDAYRKRLRHGYAHYQRTGNLEYHIESIADEPITGELNPSWTPTTETRRLPFYLGDQGELFGVALSFRTTGHIAFDKILIDYLLKTPRRFGG